MKKVLKAIISIPKYIALGLILIFKFASDNFLVAVTISKFVTSGTVVLNLELLDHEQSQRVVDFLAGATYALSGHQQKIGEGVFIFTPNNVNITAEQEKKAAASITDAFWNQVK